MSTETTRKRGRDAESPQEIPHQGWKEVSLRLRHQLRDDHTHIVSAGIAFFFFLALFPALAAFLSIYGLVVDPSQVQQQLSQLTALLPAQAHQLISDIFQRIAETSPRTLGWSLVVSLLISIWSTKKGMSAVFEGVNMAYDEDPERGFFAKLGLELLFTLGAIVMGIVSLALVLAFPAIASHLGLPEVVLTLIDWGRWLILAFAIVGFLSLIYKYAPHRSDPKFHWVSWGAVISTLLWIAGSLLFSLFVSRFGNFDNTYGSFAAVIILMLWFFLTGFCILLGAEINSELEHQTAQDTTVGEDQPMGHRGAYHADHVAGEPHPQ